jgi:hypothetical protein
MNLNHVLKKVGKQRFEKRVGRESSHNLFSISNKQKKAMYCPHHAEGLVDPKVLAKKNRN